MGPFPVCGGEPAEHEQVPGGVVAAVDRAGELEPTGRDRSRAVISLQAQHLTEHGGRRHQSVEDTPGLVLQQRLESACGGVELTACRLRHRPHGLKPGQGHDAALTCRRLEPTQIGERALCAAHRDVLPRGHHQRSELQVGLVNLARCRQGKPPGVAGARELTNHSREITHEHPVGGQCLDVAESLESCRQTFGVLAVQAGVLARAGDGCDQRLAAGVIGKQRIDPNDLTALKVRQSLAVVEHDERLVGAGTAAHLRLAADARLATRLRTGARSPVCSGRGSPHLTANTS